MDSAAVAVVPPPAALAVLHEVSELEGAEMALVQSVVAVVERADDGTKALTRQTELSSTRTVWGAGEVRNPRSLFWYGGEAGGRLRARSPSDLNK